MLYIAICYFNKLGLLFTEQTTIVHNVLELTLTFCLAFVRFGLFNELMSLLILL